MVLALSEGTPLRREHQASPMSCYGSRANCPINLQVIVNGFSCSIYGSHRIVNCVSRVIRGRYGYLRRRRRTHWRNQGQAIFSLQDERFRDYETFSWTGNRTQFIRRRYYLSEALY